MIQHEVIELIERLNQERLFVNSEVKAITKLNDDVGQAAAEAFKAAWIAQQQRRNLAALIQNETKAVSYCKRAALLESTTFVDGYRHLNQHEPKYGEWMTALRSDPSLIAAQLLQAERLAMTASTPVAAAASVSPLFDSSNSAGSSEIVNILLSGVFGCCVLRCDEAAVAEILLTLARNAYGGTNSGNVHRRSSSKFHVMFSQFIECLPSVRLFLTSALQPAVMLLLMKDDSHYDLDPQKTHHAFIAARRPSSRSPVQRKDDSAVTFDRDSLAAAAVKHRSVVVQQMLEVLHCLISSIRRSVPCFPPALLWLINQLYHNLVRNDGCSHEIALIACTDVIFESFICPALLNAAVHGLTLDAPVSAVAQHNLTEVARILRILAHTRSRQTDTSFLQPSVAASLGDDILSSFDKQEGLSDVIDALIMKTGPEKPPFASKDVNGIVRTTALITLADLRRLVAFQKGVAQSLPEGDPTRVRTEMLLSELPPLPPAPPSLVTGASPATGPQVLSSSVVALAGTAGGTPPGTPSPNRSKAHGKKLSLVGPSAALAAATALTANQNVAAVDAAESRPEEVLVITLQPANQEIGLMAEHKVIALAEEHVGMSGVSRRVVTEGEGLVKRTRFSLTAATAHSSGVGDVSELGDVISEAASVHSVGSTTLDNEDMGIDPDADDDLSDMVSANVSGRGSPNVSGRDTPQSSIGGGGEGDGSCGGDDNRGSESSIGRRGSTLPVANIPVTIKKAEEDLPDRFGMFDIGNRMAGRRPGAAGGDLEVRSTVSDTWSTDVLGGSDVGGGAGGGTYDDDDEDGGGGGSRQLQRRLLEVDDDPPVTGALNVMQLQQPPQPQLPQRPLSAGLLLLGSLGGGMSETASESAWSTDVLAASDTSERPSERLRELDNIDEQLQNMGFVESANDGSSRLNIDDIESDASENSDDVVSSDTGSSDQSSSDRCRAARVLLPSQSTPSKPITGQSELMEASSRAQQNTSPLTASRPTSAPAGFGQSLLQDFGTSAPSGIASGRHGGPSTTDNGLLTATQVWRKPGAQSSSKDVGIMEMFDPLVTTSTASASAPAVGVPQAFPAWMEATARGPVQVSGLPPVVASGAIPPFLPMGRQGTGSGSSIGSSERKVPARPASYDTEADLHAAGAAAADTVAARPPSWPARALAQPRTIPGMSASPGAGGLLGSSDSGLNWTNQDSSSMRSDGWDSLGSGSPQHPWKGMSPRSNFKASQEAAPLDTALFPKAPLRKSDSTLSSEDALAELGLVTPSLASAGSTGAAEDKTSGDKKKKTLFQSLKNTIKGKRREGKEQQGQGLENKLYDSRASISALDEALTTADAATATRGNAVAGTAEDSGDDILAKYRSVCHRSTQELDRQQSVQSDNMDVPEPLAPAARIQATAASQTVAFDPLNIENCSAFMDAKKKLRLVLSSADPEVLRYVGAAPLSHTYDPSVSGLVEEDNDIVKLLQVLLSHAISLQSKPVIAQLHETIRCLRQFKHKSACRRLLRAMKEDYRRRVHYVTYLTRSRQGLMVSLTHLQRMCESQSRDRDVCHSCFVSEYVRIYLHKKESALVELREGFAQFSAPDDKCDMVERGLEALCLDMDRDVLWQAASEQQLDSAQLAIERHVMAFVFQDAMFPNSDADLERDRIFHESVRRLGQGLRPNHVELKIPPKYHMEFPWKSAQEEIVMLNLYKTPRDKLQCVVCCCKVIMNLLSMAGEERSVPAADDFLPVFICVVALANPEYLLSTLQYVDSFYSRRMEGEEMYWWMQLKSAVAFITMWMQKETQVASMQQPQRGSSS